MQAATQQQQDTEGAARQYWRAATLLNSKQARDRQVGIAVMVQIAADAGHPAQHRAQKFMERGLGLTISPPPADHVIP